MKSNRSAMIFRLAFPAAVSCAALLPRPMLCAQQQPANGALPDMQAVAGMTAAAMGVLRDSGASLNLTLWSMQLAVAKQPEIAAASAEIQQAASACGTAKDAKTREAAWRKVGAAEKNLFKLLDLELGGMKLSPADKLAAKKAYWRMAAAEIEKNESNFTDPAAKKFFASKKAMYKAKSSVSLDKAAKRFNNPQ